MTYKDGLKKLICFYPQSKHNDLDPAKFCVLINMYIAEQHVLMWLY